MENLWTYSDSSRDGEQDGTLRFFITSLFSWDIAL